MARKAIVDGGAPNGQTTMKNYTPVGEARKGELVDGRYVYNTLTEKAGSILNDAKTGVQNAANTAATTAKNGAATLSDYISNARAQLEQVQGALTEKKEDLEAAKEESGNYADKKNLDKQIAETDRKITSTQKSYAQKIAEENAYKYSGDYQPTSDTNVGALERLADKQFPNGTDEEKNNFIAQVLRSLDDQTAPAGTVIDTKEKPYSYSGDYIPKKETNMVGLEKMANSKFPNGSAAEKDEFITKALQILDGDGTDEEKNKALAELQAAGSTPKPAPKPVEEKKPEEKKEPATADSVKASLDKLAASKSKGLALMKQKAEEDEKEYAATQAATQSKAKETTQPTIAELLSKTKANTKQDDSFKYDSAVGGYTPKSYQMIDGVRKSAGDTLAAAQKFIDKILKGEKDSPIENKTFKTVADAVKFVAGALKSGDNAIGKEKSLQLAKQKAAEDEKEYAATQATKKANAEKAAAKLTASKAKGLEIMKQKAEEDDEDKKKLDTQPLVNAKAKGLALMKQKDAEDEQARLDRERQTAYDEEYANSFKKKVKDTVTSAKNTAASVKRALEDTYYNTRYKLTGKAMPYDPSRYDVPKETKKEALARIENSKAKGMALMQQKDAEDEQARRDLETRKKAAQARVDDSKNKAKTLLEELTGLTAEERAEKERNDAMNREGINAIERDSKHPYDPFGEYEKAKARENLPETLANLFQRGGMESSVVNALLTSGALDDDDFDERTIETIYNSLPNEYISAIEDLLGNKLKKHSAESSEELLDMLAAIGEEVIEHGDLDYICHYGIKGQTWGIRRYQNADGSLTEEGRQHYGVGMDSKEMKKRASYEREAMMGYRRTDTRNERKVEKYTEKLDTANEKGNDTKSEKYAKKLEEAKKEKEALDARIKFVRERIKNMPIEQLSSEERKQITGLVIQNVLFNAVGAAALATTGMGVFGGYSRPAYDFKQSDKEYREYQETKKHSDSDYICHSGIPGQRWGERNGPPYPLSRQNKHSEIEKGALFVRDTYNNTRVHQLTKNAPDATKTNLVNKGNNQQGKSDEPKAQKIDTAQKIAQYAGAANAVASGLTNTYSQYLSLANARKREDYEAVYTGDLDTTLVRELDTAQAKMMAAAADENAKKSAYEASVNNNDDEGKRTKAEAAYAKAKATRIEAEKAYSDAIDAANHRGSAYLKRYDDTMKTVDEHIRTEGPKPKTDTQSKIMGGLQAATAISGLALTVGQFLTLLKQNK